MGIVVHPRDLTGEQAQSLPDHLKSHLNRSLSFLSEETQHTVAMRDIKPADILVYPTRMRRNAHKPDPAEEDCVSRDPVSSHIQSRRQDYTYETHHQAENDGKARSGSSTSSNDSAYHSQNRRHGSEIYDQDHRPAEDRRHRDLPIQPRSHHDDRQHCHPREEEGYRDHAGYWHAYPEQQVQHAERSYDDHHKQHSHDLNDHRERHHDDHREKHAAKALVPLSSSHPTPNKALHSVARTLGGTITFFSVLQESYDADTRRLHFVAPEVLNYIWQDKVRFDRSLTTTTNPLSHHPPSHASPQPSDHQDPQEGGHTEKGDDAHAVLKRLSHALNIAVDSTVHALKRSDGDNRSLAEKLARLARDIEGSRERVFKKRGEVEVLMTELEMLAVLLRRHGADVDDHPAGGDGAISSASYAEEARDEGSNNDRGRGGDVVGIGAANAQNGNPMRKVRREKKERIVFTRTESYVSPSVVDEGEEEEDGDEGSGVQVIGHGDGETGHVGNGEKMEGKMVEVVEVRETS